MDWSADVERALLRALLEGRFGGRRETLPPDVVTGVRRRLLETIQDYRAKYGAWPGSPALGAAVRLYGAETDEARRELRLLFAAVPDLVRYAVDELRPLVKRAALRAAAVKIDALADNGCDTVLARRLLEEALAAGEPDVPVFNYASDPLLRHTTEAVLQTGGIVCPTGIATLDQAMRGGLKSGEVGLIMGPTKRGKSHFAVAFGAAELRRGGYVLHITLELCPPIVASRYDRCLTGMGDDDIRLSPSAFQIKLLAAVPDARKLMLRGYPRFGATVSAIGELVRKELDRLGHPFLVILDYGSILKPEKQDVRHVQVEEIHERLSTLTMGEQIPLWTPYQTNRAALAKEAKGEISLAHAGESYGSLCHADVVLTLGQDEGDYMNRRLLVSLEAARDTAEAAAMVQYDWARTTLTEVTVKT